MSILSALQEIPNNDRISYLQDYFSPDTPTYSGAHFNSFQVSEKSSNQMTLADLYSVNLLALDIPGSAGLSILGTDAASITGLLKEIPDEPIGKLTDTEFAAYLGKESAAWQLWKLLKSYHGMGIARVSKLMARKRPHLIPIRDSIVARVAKFKSGDDDWHLWWKTLHDNPEIETQVECLRKEVDQPTLSTLRVLDILLWYSGKSGIHKNS
ncbi:hypothetical protein GCM10023190_23190 [Enteractinococcus fodinae]|uniref:Uncharacterized protein n=1 Tax=Enteractinococcus fodinae TaxID=684663 RepID=A0ABU2B6A5_9MICC|nr:DUF6308 family protein [Enteractinococcus fodinae]MDR7347919.1 hypothetical protein [Enteractinococcus fodinae]